MSLLYNCLLPESQIKKITLINNKNKSVRSFHPYKSVIQTSYDIVKAMADPDPDSYRDEGEKRVSRSLKFNIQLLLH